MLNIYISKPYVIVVWIIIKLHKLTLVLWHHFSFEVCMTKFKTIMSSFITAKQKFGQIIFFSSSESAVFDFCNVCQCSCCYLLGATSDSKNPLVLEQWSALLTSGFHLFYVSAHFCSTGLLWVVGCKGNMAWDLMHTNNLQNMVLQYVFICDRSKARALDRRKETGRNTFSSVQTYQCHTPVKFSVESTVSVT